MEDWIITPTYNERQNIEKLIPLIFDRYPNMRIMVVDDNSPDKTEVAVRELQKKYPRLELRSRPGKAGIATAYLETIAYLLSRRSEIGSIITMDADLSHDPRIIEHMHRLLKEHDVVIGSRYVPGGSLEKWEWWRRILSHLGNAYARFITHIPIHDLTSGFMCFRGDFLRTCNFSSIKSHGFAFLIEFKALAYAAGARIAETPITFTGRYEGISKLSQRIIYEGITAPWVVRKLLKCMPKSIKKEQP
jgi:dolichol-phosphate mannosyltransferase